MPHLFSLIQYYIQARNAPFFVGHIRAHSLLPCPLAEGNEIVDQATQLTFLAEINSLAQAKEAHSLHHINAQTLRLLFKITREQV